SLEPPLPLAVISQPPGLQDAAAGKGGERFRKTLVMIDLPESGGWNADAVEVLLLDKPVLRHFERPGPGQDRNFRRKPSRCLDRHILEFVGDDVAAAGELGERRRIVIGRDDLAVGDLRGRTVGARFQNDCPVGKARRRHRQHAPELAAAENADGRIRGQGRHCALSGYRATFSVWLARQESSLCATVASESASMEAAMRAALTAPDRPMASVPTGTPAGICTMERSESWPDSAFDSIGTPSTGNGVSAAVIPGRCAAPPAPAMMTLYPAARAPRANSYSRSGVRWAETIRASWEMPRASSVSAAWIMVDQSDWLPMMMATSTEPIPGSPSGNHAMMSGIMRSSVACNRSLSCSFFFFSRWI